MVKSKILVTGDWDEGLDSITKVLESSHFEAIPISGADIKNAVKKRISDCVIFCIKEDSQDLQLRLLEIKRTNDALPVFVFAKAGSVEFAISLIKKSVNDFWLRPLDDEKIIKKIDRELHLYLLTKQVFMSDNTIVDDYRFENMIGRSQRMQDNFQMIAAVAKSNATVLITGESGTGKELVAKAIHRRSERVQHRIVDLNCGAIPKELLENELFGHEKGSFTGAHKRYIGSFETAHHGSLFLDEISEMDTLLQVKLLRVLQERSFSRVGGNEIVKVDVRIIAATNRNLPAYIEKGQFREDLYYRLNVVNIELPSLRERREDIPLLAKNFLDYYSAKNNRIFIDFATDAMETLINYDWPGNVRELENTIERLVVLHDSSQVKLKQLPPHIQKVDLNISLSEEPMATHKEARILPLEDLEKQAIEAALFKFQGNIAVAAKKLKIGQATLYRKVKKFGLQVS